MCLACGSEIGIGYFLAPLIGMGAALAVVKFEKTISSLKNKFLCRRCGHKKEHKGQ